MAIHESGEDYLEAILMIQKRNGNVRSIDIAHELSFSKPSVSAVSYTHLIFNQGIFSCIGVAACLSSVCHCDRYRVGICDLLLVFQDVYKRQV